MQNINNRTIAKNAIYMYMRMIVLMLVSLYTTRVVLKALGIDDYGLYNVVGGIVVFFTFINSGLAGATKRFIIAELATGTIDSQQKIYSLALKAHLLLVLFVFIAGETLGLWMLLNAMNIPTNRMGAAIVVYQASLVTASINILKTLYNSIIISFEKMSAYAYFSIIEAVLMLIMVWILQHMNGDRLIIYALLVAMISIAILLIYYIYCRRKFDVCRYIKVKDNKTFLSLFSYVGWTLFGSGANVLSRQGVNMLVNNFYSVTVNAAIGLSSTIANVATQFVQNLQVAFSPQISKKYISQAYPELTQLTIQSSRYTSYLVMMIMIPVFFVISNLLTVWLGSYPKYTEEFCIITLLCVFVEAISMPLTTLITSDKKIGNYQITISISYMLIFVLSWIGLRLGMVPYIVAFVRLSLDVVLVIIRLLYTVHLVPDFLWKKWCVGVLLKSVLIILLCLPIRFLKNSIVWVNDLGVLVTMTSISIVWLFFLIWIIGLTKEEKRFIISKATSLSTKSRGRI